MESKKASIQKTIYDNAKNHFLGNFPETLPIEQAYVHIGMYLGWVIDNDLYSEYFEDEAELQIIRFKRRELGCTILSELWDGYLGYELFNREGNMVSYYYYGGGLYRNDYEDLLAGALPSLYHVNDSWNNFDMISKRISQKHQEWRKMVKLDD